MIVDWFVHFGFPSWYDISPQLLIFLNLFIFWLDSTRPTDLLFIQTACRCKVWIYHIGNQAQCYPPQPKPKDDLHICEVTYNNIGNYDQPKNNQEFSAPVAIGWHLGQCL